MRRRWLEIAILAFGALFLAFVALSFRPGRRPGKNASKPESLPAVSSPDGTGQATTVLKGFDYTETLRGKPMFRIQSERTVGFGAATGLVPNVYVLEKVTLTLYPERGEPVTVHSDRAEYDQRTKQARLSGNVRWSDEEGAFGETEKIDFEPSKHLLFAEGAIHFVRGTFDLTAPSGRYDLERRQVLLEGPVQGRGSGEGSGGLTQLSADGAAYRRDESLVDLSGHVKSATASGDDLSADRLVLKLEGDQGRLQWARAEGSVRGTLASSPSGAQTSASSGGGPRHYAADAAALLFDGVGQAQSLSLNGTPASVADSRGRLAADTIEVAFRDGHASSATARGHVRVDSEKSQTESEHASASFSSAGDIDSLELSGDVRIHGEDRSGRAQRAVDVPARGIWVLTGEGGSAFVEGGKSRLSANRIEIDEQRRFVTGDGNARAVFTPEPEKPGQTERRGPALVGDPSKPTYGKASRIILDDGSRLAILSGAASLWQDDASLSGDDITLNDAQRSAIAVGSTRTVFLSAESRPEKTAPPRKAEPSVVTAHRVTYKEKEATAVFDGGVTMARGAWLATATKATALLGTDRKIDRVDLEGSVTLNDAAQGRSGRADKATDLPREGKTVLEGTPAWVTDAQGDRVTGAVLTLTDQGRRVEVTAPSGGKTETIHRTRTS